jgi:hypothetical protein
MGRGIFIVMALAPLLAGCFGFGFDFGAAPPATNPAVVACEQKARDQGYDDVGQLQVMPLGEGRYSIELQTHDDRGYGQTSCTYDPKTGATVPPPKKT